MVQSHCNNYPKCVKYLAQWADLYYIEIIANTSLWRSFKYYYNLYVDYFQVALPNY